MNRPENLKTKIFLDSGNPEDTREMLKTLGFLDGQTTNPSLVVKNPEVQKYIESGKKFGNTELLSLYKEIIQDISKQIPEGSVSIEVYADENSSVDDLIKQAEEMYQWVPNAHIKLPTTEAGLMAADRFTSQGGRVNMTLVFSQEQAMAIHLATLKARNKGDVFVSPFIGRLDDIGQNGMDLIENILKMYQELGSKVEVLAASTRSLDHHLACLALESDVVTSPLKLIEEWAECEKLVPENFEYQSKGLEKIEYKNLSQEVDWESLDYGHELTDKGLQKFADDWNNLLG